MRFYIIERQIDIYYSFYLLQFIIWPIMIIELSHASKTQKRKLSWRQQFQHRIFNKNKLVLKKIKQKEHGDYQEDKRSAEDSFLKLFAHEKIEIKDKTNNMSCHSFYSMYIPLSIQCRFDDQLTCTFSFIRNIQEKGRFNDKILFYMQISEHMKKCRAEGRVDSGWYECLQKYICNIDSLQAAQIYTEFKKCGTQALDVLHQKYGKKCLKDVFFEKICNSKRFFKREQSAIKDSSPLSIESNEEINQITMSKTMKMLFCSICLIYDCGQHALDDHLKDKHYQYISPKNKISQREKLRNAILIIQNYKDLIEKGSIKGQECSKYCYIKLNLEEWKRVQSFRSKILSPVVKGLIKIGIEMYSYSPCDIWNMLIEQGHNESKTVCCSLVFLFLIEEYNLIGRFNVKLMDSQYQMLSRVSQIELAHIPEPARKKKRAIKIAHTEHNYTINSCCHYFIGEENYDVLCQMCACRQRGFCIPQCLCPANCPIRKKGCNCKKDECRTKKCNCFNNKQQCDPLLCSNCFGENKNKNCKNSQILNGDFKKTRIGRSSIEGAGLGLFAGQDIKKDDLVMIYTGELIDQSIDLLRQSLSADNSFYNFGSPEGTIDARFMGNMSRFINHGDQGKENLRSQNKLSQGRYKIGFYAQRDIYKNEQLFFDYDGQGELYKNYKEKYPFINPKKTMTK